MLLRTLGGLRLEGADFSRPKPLLLVAYLAVEGPRDRRYLSRLFWPRSAAPLTNLRTALSQLRHDAPGVIRADEARLSTDIRLDVRRILDEAALDRNASLEELYPGPFLEGLYLPDMSEELEEWVFATRELVAETVRAHLLEVAEELAARGDKKLASRRAEAAWRLPGASDTTPETLERLYRLLRTGGSPLANQVRAEATEYGIELGEGAADDPLAPGMKRKASPNNLGHRATSFEGRDPELLELSNLLGDRAVRLVTLIGPGGSGKTSLALVAAHQELHADTFPSGVYFVDLESSSGEQALLSEIAAVLDADAGEEPVTAIVEAVADRRVLLLLDNCEHLPGHMGPVGELLSACGNLTVLATSRERLNLPGEQLFPVDGLPYPEPGDPATSETRYLDSVRLFEKRAKRVDLSFALDEHNLHDVARICNAVVGSPLAIELAAALVGVLTPREIANELGSDKDLLSAPNLHVPDRHKSLRATFEHSWRLLSGREQEALAALAVFAGGFTREAAARVAGLTIPILSSLVDKSLVRGLGHGRFGCHPLIRSYALEKLERAPERAERTRQAHADYLIGLGSKREPAGTSLDMERVYAEHENYRAALARSVRDEDWLTALELVASVWAVWHAKGEWREARRWLEGAVGGLEASLSDADAIERLDQRTARALAEALRGIGILARSQGDLEAAQRRTAESLEMSLRLGDEERVGSMTNQLGVIALHRGDFETAESRFVEALAVRRRIGDRSGVAATLNNLGAMAGRLDDLAAAERYYSEGLSLYRELGMDTAVALVLGNLGDVAEARGDMAAARELYEESMSLNQASGNRIGIAACSARLAAVLRRHGDLCKAEELCLAALGTFHELDDVEGVAECLNELGMVLLGADRPEQAATAWGAMKSLLESAGTTLAANQEREHDTAVASARAATGPESFERAYVRGGAMSFEETLRFAQSAGRAAEAGKHRR